MSDTITTISNTFAVSYNSLRSLTVANGLVGVMKAHMRGESLLINTVFLSFTIMSSYLLQRL